MASYKIVRVASISYPAVLHSLYRENPELNVMPYDRQMEAIMGLRSCYSDWFSRSMAKLGNEAHEIIHNAVNAQKMWARERGLIVHEDQPISNIVFHQIAELKPDVVYYQGSCPFSEAIQKSFRRRFPFIKLVVMYIGFPLPVDNLRNTIDYVFAGSYEIQKQCQTGGVKSQVVHHGFDEALLDLREFKGPEIKYDFTFIGTSGYDHRLNGLKVNPSHATRYLTLIELIKRTDIRIWEQAWRLSGHGAKASINILESGAASLANVLLKLKTKDSIRSARSLKNILRSQMGAAFLRICENELTRERKQAQSKPPPGFPSQVSPLSQMFPDKCKGPIFGLPMYEVLAQSKVTFNIHTDMADNIVGNMRMFEATGVGSCLLTDTGSNMPDLFESGIEAVTYTSIDDLVEKAAFLIDNDDERKKIAQAGQRRTLRDHTVFRRCEQIDQKIKALLRAGHSSPQPSGFGFVADVHIVSSVTTKQEARLYTDITLPNMLSKQNQSGLKGRKGVTFFLYTTTQLLSEIKQSPLFESLASVAPVEAIIMDFSETPNEEPAVTAYRMALSQAAEMRAALIVIDADMVLSDGALPRLCKLGQDEKKYLALAPEIHIDKHRGAEEIKTGLASGSNVFSFSNLARIAISELQKAPNAKPGVLCGLVDLPRRIYMAIGKEGFLIRGDDFRPVLTWPRSVSFLNLEKFHPRNVSTDLFFKATPSPVDIHIVTDSAEMVVMRLTDNDPLLGKTAESYPAEKESPSSGISQLRLLPYYYRLHEKALSARWRETEIDAERDIMRVKRNYSIRLMARDIANIVRWIFSSATKNTK